MEVDGKTSCPRCKGLGHLGQGAGFTKEGEITEVPPSCLICEGSGEIDADKIPLMRLTHLVSKKISEKYSSLPATEVYQGIVANMSAGFDKSDVKGDIDLDGLTVFSDESRKGDDHLNKLIEGPQGFLDEAKTILGLIKHPH